VELYLHSPSTPSWRGAQLKHRDNFTFTFTFYYTSSAMSCRGRHFIFRRHGNLERRPAASYLPLCAIIAPHLGHLTPSDLPPVVIMVSLGADEHDGLQGATGGYCLQRE
jgi:hypothetical protein